ncbi:MAG: twin-arginine translocase subunit TatC [Bacteroidales bacterium]|nr:twin-arginine translocase subunit TatC [Bacteroidales bacterium]
MEKQEGGTFWEHLDVLRWALIRSIVVLSVLAVVIFSFKEFLFDGIIFAPSREDFILFRLFQDMEIEPVNIINTKLSAQLFIHLSTSFYFALIVGFPYILGEVWFFLKPALYENEKKMTVKALVSKDGSGH